MFRVRYKEADHNILLANFGWLSVRNLIKLDMGIFIYKELNKKHPERTNTIFFKVDNIYIPIGQGLSLAIIFSSPEEIHRIFKKQCDIQEACYGMKSQTKLE